MKKTFQQEVENAGFKVWDQKPGEQLSVDDIIKMYENGFAGSICSEEAEEELLAQVTFPYASQVCDTFGYGESAAGKLIMPFTYIDKYYGSNQWHDPAQGVGNCVSRGQTYANLTTLVSEVHFAQPDQLTGLLEMLPKDTRKNKNACPLACEPVYWFRGSGGHGWYCSASTQTSINFTGATPRINIDGVGDFSQYDERLGSKYGARKPPQDVIDKINNNLFREATKIDSFESLRELLNRGFGINSCGSQGFASKRDENGVARRQGSWAHSMAYIACDDRPEIIRIYNEPLVLVLNSWGPRWISGPTKIYGTSVDIPNGSFWAKWSDIKNRDAYAIAGLNGWARQELPNLEPDFI